MNSIPTIEVLAAAAGPVSVIAMTLAVLLRRAMQSKARWESVAERRLENLRLARESLLPLQMKEDARQSHLRAIAAKGKATQLAAVAARRDAADAKTRGALTVTPIRPREAVVADVIPARKARQARQ